MPLLGRQDRRDAAEGASLVLIGAIALVVVAFIVGALVWWLGVSTSGTKGAGDEQKQQNSVTNRVFWQGEFNSLFQNVQTYTAQIAQAEAQIKTNPADSFAAQNLAGLRQECDIAVGQYNADALKPIAVPWLPAGLPASIDRTTACGG
jgi:hypothetical protein